MVGVQYNIAAAVPLLGIIISVADPYPHQTERQDPDPDPHQSDKLDPDTDPHPHKFADEKPKCIEYEPI